MHGKRPRKRQPEDSPCSARDLLSLARRRGALLSEAELEGIEAAKRLDTPPEDKWASRA